MRLDEATVTRLRRLLLDDKTIERYRRALAEAPDSSAEAFCVWVASRARDAPLGTVLPLRAAANHVLQARWKLDAETASAMLPPGRGRAPVQRDSLSTGQLALYYSAAHNWTQGPVRTVLLLLPRTALRIEEIVTLRWEHRQLHQGIDSLIVTGKRDEVRIVRLSSAARAILDAWTEYVAETRAADSPWMFASPRDSKHPISAESVGYACRKLRAKHPELGKLTPHVLRHTWATRALAAGVDLKAVQTVLGHKRLETTSIYLHPTGDDLAEAMERADQDDEE